MENLHFKGHWRDYQKRILERSRDYMADGQVHISAAPGSGKTTLGIEFIRRFDKPALILVPTITIREQWADRIKTAFLSHASEAERLVSQDLKTPKMITIATYQALHSALSQYKGKLSNLSEEEGVLTENVDFSQFDLVNKLQEIGLGTLCLDECHHLRNEWWKSLEEFRDKYSQLNLIALTATPPYDSEPALWDRYISLCGEIDEEITIPELVKEGSICPHQDFVYFSYPDKEEKEQIKRLERQKRELLNQVLNDQRFIEAMQNHRILTGNLSTDELLEQPVQLSALLIFLQSRKLPYPAQLKKLLGARRLPALDLHWLEILLQGFLYQVHDWYRVDDAYRKELKSQFKAAGLIEKRQVTLVQTGQIEKIITQSLGKLSSIQSIFQSEYQVLGDNLHQLILTDYIRKDFAKFLGDTTAPIRQLGVLPFFETIRRQIERENLSAKVSVVCGSLVVVPSIAREYLRQSLKEAQVEFYPIGQLDESEYVEVRVSRRQSLLVAAVTELFNQGIIQVLIGTKSLLGEGWDAPSVNSLILASFVGSFMLSNQMRGRAIRTWIKNPEKTSNIWHLVSINPYKINNPFKKEAQDIQTDLGENSRDLSLLKRRMEHFLGLSYDGKTIENGLQRLNFLEAPYSQKRIEKSNRDSLQLSQKRKELFQGWKEALVIHEAPEIVDNTIVDTSFVPNLFFVDVLKIIRLAGLLGAIQTIAVLISKKAFLNIWFVLAWLVFFLYYLLRFLLYRSPYRNLGKIGQGIRQALLEQGTLSSEESKIVSSFIGKDRFVATIFLKGGTLRDKEIFSRSMKEFFEPISNQRYILKSRHNFRDQTAYFAIPKLFASRKQDAQQFLKALEKNFAPYELIYTRSQEGRKELLRARLLALANKEDRIWTKKKVESPLK